MKTAFLALFLSTTALADTCFTRTDELRTNQISMTQDYCFNKVEIKDKKVELTVDIDGKPSTMTRNLAQPIMRTDGAEVYFVQLENASVGGNCDYAWEVQTVATVTKKPGLGAVVSDVNGGLKFSNDPCHSEFRLIQKVSFKKI